VVYYEWGDPASDRVVICVHGLSRNGRDFDVLGEALADTHRVIAVDMPGTWREPMVARRQRLRVPDVSDRRSPRSSRAATRSASRGSARRWARCSAWRWRAQRDTPVARLVVNDAGPLVEPAALARIRDYLGLAPTFATFAEADVYIRAVSAPFGALTDAQWEHLTHTSVAPDAGGPLCVTYDPGIALPFAMRQRLPTCGPYGTRSGARPSCCEAHSRTCCPPPPPRP
jgi:pimeloyl-ACP methyl ester carboxylesterase